MRALANLGWHAKQVTTLSEGDTDLIGVNDAAGLLGVSPDTVRRRAAAGELTVARTKGGHRKFRRCEVEALVASDLKAQAKTRPASMQLTREQQAGVVRIAEAATTLAFRKYPQLVSDWDQVYSDAMLGITKALRQPPDNGIPWNVSCWNYANWEILKGIRGDSPVPAKQYAAGTTTEDLPPAQQPARSLDQLFEVTPEGWLVERDAFLSCVARVDLDRMLFALSREQRVVLVNTVAHRFTDEEVATEMGLNATTVGRIRKRALQVLEAGERAEHSLRGCALAPQTGG